MPITKSISSLSNVKQLTGADSPQNPGSLVTYTYGPAVSTSGQTVINLGFSVSTTNTANFFLWIDGKLMSLGSSNDYTFTNVQSNGTSSQVTMNSGLLSGLNINAVYLGVLIPNAASTSILTINATIALQPTISVATLTTHSGNFSAAASGTYTPPAGVKYLKIKMVGGGGGGGGGSEVGDAVVGGNGGTGGNTTFGTSLLTANGGSGAPGGNNVNGGNGGVATINSPAIGTAFSGGQGATGLQLNSSQGQVSGGSGASSPFGSGGGAGGGGSTVQTGQSPSANTGAGGGGGTATSGGGTYGTGVGGGGSGGYIDAILTSPSGSYTFTVGAAGAGGTAGTHGNVGGAGAGGIIIIEEHYI